MEETNDTVIKDVPCHQCSDIDLHRVFRGGYKMPHKVIILCLVPGEQLRSPCPLCRLVAEAIIQPIRVRRTSVFSKKRQDSRSLSLTLDLNHWMRLIEPQEILFPSRLSRLMRPRMDLLPTMAGLIRIRHG
ncbi:unnamed protein product [Clonostachys rosea]|uniref:Uncharacterized protein n=1 Tax=Bionectria ochroleuca TaxID=29856 RepID=A0ABY6UKW6_BIOOC|nr:unnamed protein product [Clonostachys rosea]